MPGAMLAISTARNAMIYLYKLLLATIETIWSGSRHHKIVEKAAGSHKRGVCAGWHAIDQGYLADSLRPHSFTAPVIAET